MGDGDLTAALPGTAATVVEDRGAAWGGIAVSTVAVTAGEGAAAPVFSVETAVCEGLRPPWAKPEVTATPANAIPKTQPSDVRVFIYPHELLMVFNCRASAHNIRRPALPLYSAAQLKRRGRRTRAVRWLALTLLVHMYKGCTRGARRSGWLPVPNQRASGGQGAPSRMRCSHRADG